eukprot:scaffold2495_cov101-Isochrysis_galbana.AAC.8
MMVRVGAVGEASSSQNWQEACSIHASVFRGPSPLPLSQRTRHGPPERPATHDAVLAAAGAPVAGAMWMRSIDCGRR